MKSVFGKLSLFAGAHDALSIDAGPLAAPEIVGTPNADALDGTSGDDVISASSGDDQISGHDGADRVSGGSGNDLIHGDDPTGAAFDDVLSGNRGDDQVFGFGGDDRLIGGQGADLLDGGGGNDTADYRDAVGAGGGLYDGIDVDLIHGTGHGGDAEGDQLVNIENIVGSPGADHLVGNDVANRLLGGPGDDWINGNLGNDKIYGGDGNDIILGHSDDDHLDGGNGTDYLLGGVGNDQLTGGPGADTFAFQQWEYVAIPINDEGDFVDEYFHLGWNHDRITDFNPAEDVLHFQTRSTARLPENLVLTSQVDAHGVAGTLITIQNDAGAGTIFLEGVLQTQLTTANFTFLDV